MSVFLSTGSHNFPFHNERRVREMARLDRSGAAGRRRLLGAGRGTRCHRGCGAARPDREVQPAPAGLRGQAAGVPRARRGAAGALARACAALPPGTPGAARRASLTPAPLAPGTHQTPLPGSTHLIKYQIFISRVRLHSDQLLVVVVIQKR